MDIVNNENVKVGSSVNYVSEVQYNASDVNNYIDVVPLLHLRPDIHRRVRI